MDLRRRFRFLCRQTVGHGSFCPCDDCCERVALAIRLPDPDAVVCESDPTLCTFTPPVRGTVVYAPVLLFGRYHATDRVIGRLSTTCVRFQHRLDFDAVSLALAGRGSPFWACNTKDWED